MSTPCELLIYAPSKEVARSVAKEILIQTKELEKKYSYYDPASLLSRINARKTQELDAQSKDIFSRAKIFYEETTGVFDITLATIKPLYKLDSLEAFEREKERLLPYVGCEHFTIKKNKIFFDNPHTMLDLGGMVKEYAVDKAVALLKKRKIKSALVNFGGDIYALGCKPDGVAFKIGIKNPKEPSQHLLYVNLKDGALTTSASYERNTTIEGKSFSHILSKEEVKNTILSSSVLSNSTLISGVFSTALNIDSTLRSKYKTIQIDQNLEIHYENFDS
jgi:FAD:protein FMN transferase